MLSSSLKLEPRAKDNARKMIQAFYGVPGPVVDYAFSIVSALEAPSSTSSCMEEGIHPSTNSANGSFALRKMDSGQFGEHSLALLATPRGPGAKHRRINTFGDPNQLSFSSSSSTSQPSSPFRQ